MSERKWWEKKEVNQTTEWQALKTPEGIDYYYNTVTGVTTWDKPDELKTEDELKNQGEWIWAPVDGDCFVPATVESKSGPTVTARTQQGQAVTFSSKVALMPLKLVSLQRIVSDLVLLDDMSVPLILYNLKKRFERGEIYTNIGTILISINPYANLGLYTPEKIYEYQYRGVKEMPPHVFNIAHESYKGLCDFKMPQSVIISGESGAGKTEATKQCLSYLAAIAGSVNNVEQKVLQANPILEAFGNAKTVRNDNSSRFGKYMEVFFDAKNKIVGSTTTNYLLEKVRVIQQQADERNFHVFYQLVKAADRDLKSKLHLGNNVTDYFYLNQSGCIDVKTINDVADYGELRSAMNELLFTKQDQDDVFATTAAVLSLGNLRFAGGAKSAVADKTWVDVVAKLLQVETDRLIAALTVRELKIKGQANTKVQLDEKQASDTRHALAKFIYGNMFDWIVIRINEAMKTGISGSGSKLSIGILDIFGFEIFKQNSFEQLCINFTNEMLQQHFNNNTFKLEEQLYKNEGIQFKHVDFIDNQPVLDLIQKKPGGILSILDEELVVPKGTDQTFVEKMHTAHGKTPQYERDIKNPALFKIHHYAGLVCYDANGFLEKNRDTLTDDLLEMLHASKSKFLTALFPSDMSSKDKKSSLSKQFQGQLLELMKQLNKTEPHYIRCVKPNDFKSASTFIAKNCLEQLTYSGVFEAVAIRKQGFPFRLRHDVFVKHYGCILPDPNKQFPNPQLGCKEIIEHMKLNKSNVQMGSSMVLYRSDEHKALELQRSIKVVALEMDENLKRLCGTKIDGYTDQQKEKYFEELSRAVEQADEFRLKTDVSNRARKLLDDYIESRIDDRTKAMLQQAYDSVDERALENVLAICDQHGYKTKLCKECRRLLARIRRINEEVEVASQTVEEKHVRVCVTAADEIKLQTEWLEYFRSLVNGPPENFLEAQFKAAQGLGQHDRAIRIGVRQKDLIFQKDARSWDYSTYKKLENPGVWASKKLFGNKDVLTAGFLKWQQDKIHAPLCHYDDIADKHHQKEVKERAQTVFKYLMKYMGQRVSKSETTNTRGRQMVAQGYETPEIRDEIYIQIIKQLNGNPDANAVKLGWDMMALCLLTFPPTPEFENYLEVYLRQAAPTGKQTHQFVGWLRQRVYHGPVKTAWTEQDLENMEATLTSRSRGFSEPLPDGIPRYQDLTESYHAAGPADSTFRRDIKAAGGAGGAKHLSQASNGAVGGAGGGAKSAAMYVKPELPKPKPAPAASAWKELTDPASGDVYYYNEETGASQWDKPPELMYQRHSVAQRGW